MTNQRRTELIEQYIREHKYASLHTLATHFNASVSTVRRALDTLEESGIVRRHHGGASLIEADALTHEYDFLTGIQRQADQKFAIASLVAEHVQPGMTVILDAGTTTYAVARILAEKRVQVITNSLPVATLFSDIGQVQTIMTGGIVCGRLGVLVGPMCEQAFEQVHADLAILGGAGVTEKGVWNHNAMIMSIQRKMIAAAERTIFAIDATKFGRKALSLIAPFGPRHNIVTNTPPSPGVIDAIEAAGARLTVAEARHTRLPGADTNGAFLLKSRR